MLELFGYYVEGFLNNDVFLYTLSAFGLYCVVKLIISVVRA